MADSTVNSKSHGDQKTQGGQKRQSHYNSQQKHCDTSDTQFGQTTDNRAKQKTKLAQSAPNGVILQKYVDLRMSTN